MIRLLVLGFLESALHGCAADPNREVTDAAAADGAADAAAADGAADAGHSDQLTFEADASIVCAKTVSNTIPIQSNAGGEACLFQISPPLPFGDLIYGVRANGTTLRATEFEVHGRDTLELIGQACVDYRAGTITDVSVFVPCID